MLKIHIIFVSVFLLLLSQVLSFDFSPFTTQNATWLYKTVPQLAGEVTVTSTWNVKSVTNTTVQITAQETAVVPYIHLTRANDDDPTCVLNTYYSIVDNSTWIYWKQNVSGYCPNNSTIQERLDTSDDDIIYVPPLQEFSLQGLEYYNSFACGASNVDDNRIVFRNNTQTFGHGSFEVIFETVSVDCTIISLPNSSRNITRSLKVLRKLKLQRTTITSVLWYSLEVDLYFGYLVKYFDQYNTFYLSNIVVPTRTCGHNITLANASPLSVLGTNCEVITIGHFQFSSTGNSISASLQVSSIINAASALNGLTCSQIFASSSVTSFGVGATCSIDVAQGTVTVRLGTGATLLPGGTVQLHTNLYTRLGFTIATTNIEYVRNVIESSTPIVPIVSVQTTVTDFSALCVQNDTILFTLDASNSTGNNPLRFTWGLSVPGSIVPSRTFQRIISYLSSQTGPIVHFPQYLFRGDAFSYNFFITVRVTDRIGRISATTSVRESKVESLSLSANIDAPSLVKTYRNLNLALDIRADMLPNCPDAPTNYVTTYTWFQATSQSVATLNLSSIATDRKILSLPSFTFPRAGIYQLNVSVEVPAFRLTATSSIRVEILQRNLIASILGGNSTLSLNNTISLRSTSFDVENSNEVETYVWTCLTSTNCQTLFESLGNTGRVMTLPPASLSPGYYLVGLTYSKGGRMANATAYLEIAFGDIPTVTVAVPNPSIFSSSKVALYGTATAALTLGNSISSIVWSVHSGNLILSSDTIETRINDYTLVIKENVLTPGEAYTFRFTATDKYNLSSSALATVQVLHLPEGGTFTISPSEGTTLTTTFTLSTDGWFVRDDPIATSSLRYFMAFEDPVSGRLISISPPSFAKEVQTILPQGNDADNSLVVVVYAVRPEGGFARLSQTALVRKLVSAEPTSAEVEQAVEESKFVVEEALARGDDQTARLASLGLVQTLNIPTTDASQRNVTKNVEIRTDLLESLRKSLCPDVPEQSQVSLELIKGFTSKIEEVSFNIVNSGLITTICSVGPLSQAPDLFSQSTETLASIMQNSLLFNTLEFVGIDTEGFEIAGNAQEAKILATNLVAGARYSVDTTYVLQFSDAKETVVTMESFSFYSRKFINTDSMVSLTAQDIQSYDFPDSVPLFTVPKRTMNQLKQTVGSEFGFNYISYGKNPYAYSKEVNISSYHAVVDVAFHSINDNLLDVSDAPITICIPGYNVPFQQQYQILTNSTSIPSNGATGLLISCMIWDRQAELWVGDSSRCLVLEMKPGCVLVALNTIKTSSSVAGDYSTLALATRLIAPSLPGPQPSTPVPPGQQGGTLSPEGIVGVVLGVLAGSILLVSVCILILIVVGVLIAIAIRFAKAKKPAVKTAVFYNVNEDALQDYRDI